MSDTKIEWADSSWNPVVGCRKVSPACDHCYAERMAFRLGCMKQVKYRAVTFAFDHASGYYPLKPTWNGEVFLDEKALTEPLSWRKPRNIFVVSMGDLFYERVPFEYLDRIFAVMALCPQHTFLLLTKRPERAREYLTTPMRLDHIYDWWSTYSGTSPEAQGWPLPNCWLGVTAENQEQYDRRWEVASQIPAAKLFISNEPALSGLDMHPATNGRIPDWCIVGAESGPGARPMSIDWAWSLRDQCVAANVPFFCKQIQATDERGRIKLVKMPQLDGRVWAERPGSEPLRGRPCPQCGSKEEER